MEEQIRALVARINSILSVLEDVVWEGPTPADSISSVEGALGVQFPISFRTLLLLTGGGGVESFPISSIPSDDPLADNTGAICGDTHHYRKSWVPYPLPDHLVVIQRDANNNEPFCLDTSEWLGSECPVVLYYYNTGEIEKVAPNFFTFYENYLERLFREAGEQ